MVLGPFQDLFGGIHGSSIANYRQHPAGGAQARFMIPVGDRRRALWRQVWAVRKAFRWSVRISGWSMGMRV